MRPWNLAIGEVGHMEGVQSIRRVLVFADFAIFGQVVLVRS